MNSDQAGPSRDRTRRRRILQPIQPVTVPGKLTFSDDEEYVTKASLSCGFCFHAQKMFSQRIREDVERIKENCDTVNVDVAEGRELEEPLPVVVEDYNSDTSVDEVEEIVVRCEVVEVSEESASSDGEKKECPKKKKKNYNKPSVCEQCNKVFTTKYVMKKHLRTHTGERPYICTTCGKTYTQLGHLSIHQLTHKGIKKYSCTECSASFYRKPDLDRHEKIHKGIKPYACQLCPKSFTQKNNLVMHVKMHLGDRQHECSVCKKRFMTRSKLVLHSKRHDKDKKLKKTFEYDSS